MKQFRRPCYQTIVARDLNISDKKCWTNIYLTKVKDISNTKVAEFNYKLLNNILCNNYFGRKWNPAVKMNAVNVVQLKTQSMFSWILLWEK